jgi:hypothetical protein
LSPLPIPAARDEAGFGSVGDLELGEDSET